MFSSSAMEEKFDRIYTDYFRLALFYARSYVGNEEIAKEITQDAFLTIWEHIESVDELGHLKAYVLTITKHKCLNYLRKKKNGQQVKDYLLKKNLETNAQALADPSADECLAFEIQELLDKTLEDMPPKMRVSYCLNRFDNYTSDEIAQQMNISSRAVENSLYKATKILKKKFEDYK